MKAINFMKPRWLQKKASEVEFSADENQSNAQRSEMKPSLKGIFRMEILQTKKGILQTLSILNTLVIFVILTLINSSCDKQIENLLDELPPQVAASVNYMQTNLVSDTASYHPARLDPTLSNAWGLAINPSGIFWINSNEPGLSEVWDKNGVPKRPPVSIPSPSGIVFNSTTDFIISATSQVSKFIFASEDGKIYAWASGDSARTVADQSASNAVYKGIELAKDGGANFLYATDFHNGKIDVFDKSFNLVASKPFMDPTIPSGFAPFNIRLLDGVLFVTYAKQLAPEFKDDEKGPGNGYVNVFKTDGSLVNRFASKGKLNSPWGIEKAPKGFGQGNNVMLIGNFGDGRINVYEEMEGEFRNQLKNHGMPITIEGLWAITFPDNNVPGDDPNKLYFTAGPDDESHGIFGYLMKH